MVKVEMPRASWDTVLMLIRDYSMYSPQIMALHKEIEDQVYSQEY